MSDPTLPTPQKHHDYESWTSTWADPKRPGAKRGQSHTKRFGRVDKVSKGEAKRKFLRWLDKDYPKLRKTSAGYSVDELCREYFAQHVGTRYTIEGKRTTSVNRHRIALDSFRAKLGAMPAAAVEISDVAAWLDGFITERLIAKKDAAGNARTKTKETVNLALSYVKAMYRWGAKHKKVPDATAGAVNLVDNIRADHPLIRQKETPGNAERAMVDATLKECEPVLRDMVELLWLTGMRPGEVCRLRMSEVDTRGDVWVYQPARHKTSWRKKIRLIAFGPKAIAIIKRYMGPNLAAPIFNRPWNNKPWSSELFRGALQTRAARAGAGHWHPNMIRHTYATAVEETFGAEAVKDTLGHATLNQQRVYVKKSLERAKRVAREVG